MYRSRTNLQIGFHGCDEAVRNELVSNPHRVKKSQESYDWLGHGFYVWENNQERAYQWAEDKRSRGSLITPSVVGVLYQVDYCLDFTDSEFISVVSSYFELMKNDLQIAGKTLPKNKDLPNAKHHDLVIRELDSAVIEYLHQKIAEQISHDFKEKG